MSSIRIGDIVTLINNQDHYFEAGETGIVLSLCNSGDAIVKSYNPSYEDGIWCTELCNLKLTTIKTTVSLKIELNINGTELKMSISEARQLLDLLKKELGNV